MSANRTPEAGEEQEHDPLLHFEPIVPLPDIVETRIGEEGRDVFRRSKHVLPHVARFCLVSTFFEDGLRMYSQWSEQRDFMDRTWDCGHFLASLFVLIDVIGQLSGVFMVLLRFKVNIAYWVLFGIVVLQTVAYSWWDMTLLFRNLALLGALLLAFAESRSEGKSVYAGGPSLGKNNPKTYLQLTGRVLIIFMFMTLLRLEFSVVQMIINVVGTTLMILVVVGYKPKLPALVLLAWLSVFNLYFNAWWNIPSFNSYFLVSEEHVDEPLSKLNLDTDGKATWGEVLQDFADEGEDDKEVVLEDKDIFFASDGDGALDRKEFLHYSHPEESKEPVVHANHEMPHRQKEPNAELLKEMELWRKPFKLFNDEGKLEIFARTMIIARNRIPQHPHILAPLEDD